MLPALIAPIVGLISSVIDKAIPDRDEAEKLKAKITLAAMEADNAELNSATSIIIAEAQGGSWLQRSWRPLVMLNLVGLVTAHWLGFTPPNLPQETVNHLLDIVQVGLAGYVLGRSGEKIMKEYVKK